MRDEYFKKGLVIGIILLFVGASIVPSISGDDGNIIYVDDDAPPEWYDETHVKTIQEGVNNASAGNTVYVYSGTYYENIVINKTINLVGEDKSTTTIDGDGSTDVIHIDADWVNITKFTITGGSMENNEIYVVSDHNHIFDNTFSVTSYVGIDAYGAQYNTISGNSFTGNGLYLSSCSNWDVLNNVFSGSHMGIETYSSPSNTYIGNNFSGYTWGLVLQSASNNNVLYHNNFYSMLNEAYDECNGNAWDNGYPDGGNWWQDHATTDNYRGPNQDIPGSDGIVDGSSPNPYVINGPRQDNYPLVNPWTGSLSVFTPIVITNEPTNIEETSATLNGYLEEDGRENCSVWFEWGTTSGYGNKTHIEDYSQDYYQEDADIQTGGHPLWVDGSWSTGVSAGGLDWGYSTYKKPLNATIYSQWKTAKGTTIQFHDIPEDCWNYNATHLRFRYISNENEGKAQAWNGTWTTLRDFGAEHAFNEEAMVWNTTKEKLTDETFYGELTGLLPGTLYHYYAVANNTAGTSYGDDKVFLTKPFEPPESDAGGPYQANEGSEIIFNASGSTDPDEDELQYRWDFDNDGTWDTDYSTDPTATYTWYDDYNGTAKVEVYDGEYTDTDTGTVTMNNVAPTIISIDLPIGLVPIGTEVNLTGNFTDLGWLDTHTATIDWDDGNYTNGDIAGSDGYYIVTDSWYYAQDGVYTITLTVTDDDNGNDTEAFRYVVVYNPDGGFVTGGGWIDSPAEAYAPDPNLTGKANFGFVSKYKEGQQTPTGNTEFNFKVADLNFHSNEYDWLVVAGPKAMYKGTGTINNEGNYGFLLSAVDEELTPSTDVDLFRIKIWDKDNGDEIVYDNQLGDPEDGDPTTAIGGGQIKIHKAS